jgi:hypothetical protein
VLQGRNDILQHHADVDAVTALQPSSRKLLHLDLKAADPYGKA